MAASVEDAATWPAAIANEEEPPTKRRVGDNQTMRSMARDIEAKPKDNPLPLHPR